MGRRSDDGPELLEERFVQNEADALSSHKVTVPLETLSPQQIDNSNQMNQYGRLFVDVVDLPR
jgi:hypothetical protein